MMVSLELLSELLRIYYSTFNFLLKVESYSRMLLMVRAVCVLTLGRARLACLQGNA